MAGKKGNGAAKPKAEKAEKAEGAKAAAGKSAQRAKSEDVKGMGHNMTEIRRQANGFLKRFNALLDDKEKLCGEIMSDVKELYEEAANDIGCKRKVLRTVLTEARREMKRIESEKELEGSEKEDLETLRDALGLLADLPLGRAVVDKAEGEQANA